MNMSVHVYNQVVSSSPASHQAQAWDYLLNGQSIILRAPTGSGKTEAVVLPFLVGAGAQLPRRLIYALPLRSLTTQIADRTSQYARAIGKGEDRVVRIQHGERPESVLFAADAVIATIDQVVSSYACAPLTLPVRHGNIPAGAVISSFIVFDETHLLDPELGLQAARLICARLQRLGLPFVIMTATLPESVFSTLAEELQAEPIRSWEEFVQRNVVVTTREGLLDAEAICRVLDRGYQRILVVCNTVDRAITLFRELCPKARRVGYECELLHSRFLPEDRRRKEQWIDYRFGKNAAPTGSLLVATQVVEVGLDISADLLLTELAPIDALIQRIGRVARWGGEGQVQVFAVPSAAPYSEEIVRRTGRELSRESPWKFSWTDAQVMVNAILSDVYLAAWKDSASFQKALSVLSKASFEGSRALAAAAVRDQDTIEVSVTHDLLVAPRDALRLPWVKVSRRTVCQWINRSVELGQPVYRVVVDNSGNVLDGRPTVTLEKIEGKNIRFGDRLLFHVDVVSYVEDLGLIGEKGGRPLTPRPMGSGASLERALPRETWINHVSNVVSELWQLLLQERHAVEGLASALGCSPEIITQAALLAAILHDVGKLTQEWQLAAGCGSDASASELLGHTGTEHTNLPSHATVGAYSSVDALRETDLPRPLQRAVVFAVAHHHSVRAREVPPYRFHRSWREALTIVAERAGCLNRLRLNRFITQQTSTTSLRDRMPRFDWEEDYNAYVLLARWLRLADRMATGGANAVRDYENWFGRL